MTPTDWFVLDHHRIEIRIVHPSVALIDPRFEVPWRPEPVGLLTVRLDQDALEAAGIPLQFIWMATMLIDDGPV